MGNLKVIHLPKDNKLWTVVNKKMNACVAQTAKNFWTSGLYLMFIGPCIILIVE